MQVHLYKEKQQHVSVIDATQDHFIENGTNISLCGLRFSPQHRRSNLDNYRMRGRCCCYGCHNKLNKKNKRMLNSGDSVNFHVQSESSWRRSRGQL